MVLCICTRQVRAPQLFAACGQGRPLSESDAINVWDTDTSGGGNTALGAAEWCINGPETKNWTQCLTSLRNQNPLGLTVKASLCGVLRSSLPM